MMTLVRLDEQMRQKTSMEWSINWHKLSIQDFFTLQMSQTERRAVTIFASFNPNGYIREKTVKMMKKFDRTMPYIILRQNDWVLQVRQEAALSFRHRLQNLSDEELLIALPFADKLKWCGRSSHEEYIEMFFAVLTQLKHNKDLLAGLKSNYVRTRRICTEALFTLSSPNIMLGFERLTLELEPFLRTMIFKNLYKHGQKMDEAITIFLNVKYPMNRMLAFHYLIDTNANNTYATAEKLLLDRSSLVRETAQNVVKKKSPEFDFHKFYLDNLSLYPATAICELGEKGSPDDALEILQYLEDNRVGVVKSAMTALMRLDYEKYNPAITEMLDDNRAGVVKTARNLILKSNVTNYERVKEIFYKTSLKNTKLKCMEILFAAPKWKSIIYMLETMSCNEETITSKALEALRRWLHYFNRSLILPNSTQNGEIRKLIHSLNGILPSNIKKELIFSLPEL